MHASGLEVADIFHQAGSAYRQQHAESLSRGQRCVMGFFDQKNGLFHDTPGALAVSGL
jgi:hypothetical protein